MMTETETVDFFPVYTPFTTPPPAVAERIHKQPECHLLWAVLENGIEEYMRYADATTRRGKRLFKETEEWIMQDDPQWLCSFMSICHVLGLDPEYLRTGLRRWRATHARPILKQAA
jgi:hypothetical protein